MKIGILGCGKMGSAIAKHFKGHSLFLYDRNPEKTGSHAVNSLNDLISNSEILFLCIKPQDLMHISPELHNKLGTQKFVISILAGTPLSTLQTFLGEGNYLRCMPNLGLAYGKAMIAVTETNKDKNEIETLLHPLGKCLFLKEEMLDRFATLAASGPAFILALFEAMVEAGLILGFNKEEASTILQEMIQSSLQMLQESKKHPAELKWEIASPSGMTLAGLKTFEDEGMRAGIINTFLAAYERSLELMSDR